MTTRRWTRRGLALIFSLILVFILGVSIMSLLGVANDSSRRVRRHETRQKEFTAAELALNRVYAELRFFLEFGTQDINGAIATITPPSVPGIAYSGFEVTNLGSANEVPTTGPFAGLTLYTSTYKVELTAKATGAAANMLAHPGVSVRQDIKIRYVPLYIYGIFYDADLEILPGPAFLETGRTHSNSNIYVGAGTSLAFQNYVTSHGQIIHGYHPNDTNHSPGSQTGPVSYWNGTTGLSDWVDGHRLDHNFASWAADAITRWTGHVLDSAHSMPELPLPIPDTSDPHVLIEPASASDPVSVRDLKFNNLAGLVIDFNPATGTATGHNQAGNTVDLTYDHDNNPATARVPIYTSSTFRDNREGNNVTTINIDVQKLIAAGIAPDNGVLYVNATSNSGVRMVNGASLPANTTGGFSVATNGPLWVQGNYNTSNTKLSLLAGDSINILSPNWNDANSTKSLSNRVPTNSEVRSVVMAGNVPTDADTPYSGGVENYFRFHEEWTGRTFTFRGSIINLWRSQSPNANANWSGTGTVYNPPNRDWNWDVIYGGLAGPPGMPRVYFIDRQEWQEVDPTR
jgi:Tfp pilus assembly protein PilX